MSNPARSDSVESAEGFRRGNEVAIKLLDLSINAKTNLMRCVVENGEEETEDKVVFCSVYDYLHHPSWRVIIPDQIKDDEMAAIERIRGNPSVVSQVIEACQGSILKEIDLIHQLNCELFFERVDEAKLSVEPAYLFYDTADAFHRAIVQKSFENAAEVPVKLKSEMEKHIQTRTLWAKRKNPKATCVVKVVLHYDVLPKEFVTFHSRAA